MENKIPAIIADIGGTNSRMSLIKLTSVSN